MDFSHPLVNLHFSNTSLQQGEHRRDVNNQKAAHQHPEINFHDDSVTMVNQDVISKKMQYIKMKMHFSFNG